MLSILPSRFATHFASDTGSVWRRSLLTFAVAASVALPGACVQSAPANSTATPPLEPAPPAQSVIQPGDRIVFVGDSITGQGYNTANGWAHQIEDQLAAAHAENAPKVTSLGGSGQTVGSWTNVARKSVDSEQFLDVKGVDVKATLDGHVDVLIVMLGMNDLLSPSMDGSPEAVKSWGAGYAGLLHTLRDRTKPRVVALATIPVCTEDPLSPKNRVGDALDAEIVQLAAREGALVLPVRQALWRELAMGRRTRPDFHVTADFVHPNEFGHLAIAEGMLAGLGEAAGAGTLAANAQSLALKNVAVPALSYEVQALPRDLTSPRQTFKIATYVTAAPGAAPMISLTAPAGWEVKRGAMTAQSGEFTVTGSPDHLHNLLTLHAGARNTSIDIPPAWIVGTAPTHQVGWDARSSSFDPVKGHLEPDDALSRGETLGQPLELAPGNPLVWQRLTPNVNYNGGAAPGSVDMAAVAFFTVFQTAYGARWIYSPDERAIHFKLGSRTFADGGYLTAWVNGQPIYSGYYGKDRNKVLDASLHKGWNSMVWKSNHLQWQWQFSLDLVEDETTPDLRFSSVKP